MAARLATMVQVFQDFAAYPAQDERNAKATDRTLRIARRVNEHLGILPRMTTPNEYGWIYLEVPAKHEKIVKAWFQGFGARPEFGD